VIHLPMTKELELGLEEEVVLAPELVVALRRDMS
jgi:hypothetical protein